MELSYNNKSFEVVKNNGHFIVRNKKTGLVSTLKVRQGQDVKRLSLSIGKQKMTVIKSHYNINEKGQHTNGIGRPLKKCGFNTTVNVKAKKPNLQAKEPRLSINSVWSIA